MPIPASTSVPGSGPSTIGPGGLGGSVSVPGGGSDGSPGVLAQRRRERPHRRRRGRRGREEELGDRLQLLRAADRRQFLGGSRPAGVIVRQRRRRRGEQRQAVGPRRRPTSAAAATTTSTAAASGTPLARRGTAAAGGLPAAGQERRHAGTDADGHRQVRPGRLRLDRRGRGRAETPRPRRPPPRGLGGQHPERGSRRPRLRPRLSASRTAASEPPWREPRPAASSAAVKRAAEHNQGSGA